MVRALQRFSDCTVVTGPESGAAMDRWLSAHPDPTLGVETVPEPSWASTFKRYRIGEFLVYLAWQRRAGKVGRRLVASEHHDVAFHATLSAFWLPSIVVDLGLPSVWGPVGGAVTTPRTLWSFLGWKGVVVEAVDWFAVRVMSLLPATRRTWRTATIRIAQNDETVQRLPSGLRVGTTVLNHAMFHDVSVAAASHDERPTKRYVAWVSPMESRKGPELAVRALAMTSSDIEMVMAGDGPQRRRIEDVARELGVEDRISFEGMVPHDRALEIIQQADVALFTGLREEGGLALAEAMLLGTPVVVLANGGAAAIARASTDPERVSLIAPKRSSATAKAMAAAIERQMEQERTRPAGARRPLIDRAAAIEELERLVRAARGIGSKDRT
jgi:glycosyltransferase involved in cell wall biosynthesis